MLFFADASHWSGVDPDSKYITIGVVAISEEKIDFIISKIYKLIEKIWPGKNPHEYEIKGRLLLSKRMMQEQNNLKLVLQIQF